MGWFSSYGVPGRASAGIVAFVAAIILAAKGTYAGAIALAVIALLMFVSAWHYGRTHSSDAR